MTEPAVTWHAVVASGSELGERPVWDHRTQTLVWVDVLAGLVHRTRVGADLHAPWSDSTVSVGRIVGAVAVRRAGGLVAAADGAIRFLDDDGRDTRDPLALPLPPGHRFNDGACDPAGRFLVGTAGADPVGVLWCVDGGGRVDVGLTDLTESNGLGWSPDGRLLYFVDSAEPVVRRYAYDVDGGRIGGRLADLIDLTDRRGAPDGLVVDADGCVWVPQWRGGELARIDPHGELVGRWELPVSQPTCAAFAGRSLDRLVVATSWESMSDDERRAEPWAGHLLAADLAVRGVCPHEFGG